MSEQLRRVFRLSSISNPEAFAKDVWINFQNVENRLNSITIGDLDTTGTASSSTYLNGDGEWSEIATTDITSGVLDDARVASSNITQHEADLTLTESQISDLQAYLTSVDISDINTTGTPSTSTYLRGDGEWVTLPHQTTEVIRVPFSGPADVNVTDTLEYGTATINTITGSTVNSESISLPVGLYKFTVKVSLSGTVTNGNVGFILNKDGSPYSSHAGSNYIRNSSGHEEAGDTLVDIIEYTSSGTFSVDTEQQAASGTIALATDSYLLIEKL